jgi:hypothetical protein
MTTKVVRVDKRKVGKERKENEEQRECEGEKGRRKGKEKRIRGNSGMREVGEMDGKRKSGKGNVQGKGKGKIHMYKDRKKVQVNERKTTLSV